VTPAAIRWTTVDRFLTELEALDIRWTPEERRTLVEKAKQSIRESEALMEQRKKDRLLRMPPATKWIQ